MNRVLRVAFCLILLLLLPSALAAQATRTIRTVRVGCIDQKSFFEKKVNGAMGGYGVAYLDEIAKYTGWRYAYRFGSWSDCLAWLREGTIDLLLPAEYSAERAERYIFSKYPVCTDYAALYTAKGNDRLFYQDYAHFDGIKIGLLRDNYLNQRFKEFAAEHKFAPQYIYFDSLAEMDSAVHGGSVDAVINGNLSIAPRQKLLAKFDFMPAYFMMRRGEEALMAELNGAVYEILLDNPYFVAALNEKFYGDSSLQAKGFTREEAAFIDASDPLTVVCDANAYPYAWAAPGSREVRGIHVDILRAVARWTGLRFRFVTARTAEEAKRRVQTGEADLLLSFYGDAALARSLSIAATKPYMQEAYALVGKRGLPFEPGGGHRVAVERRQEKLRRYLQDNYPQWEFLLCGTEEECLEKAARQEATLAVVDAVEHRDGSGLNRFPELGVIFTVPIDLPVGIGVADRHGDRLREILDKGILLVGRKEVKRIILRNTFAAPAQVTLRDLLRYHLAEVSAALLVVIASLLGGVVFLIRERAKARQNAQLTRKNSCLQETLLLARHADRARDLYDALRDNANLGILQYEVQDEGRRFALLYANRGAGAILGFDESRRGDFCAVFGREVSEGARRVAASLVRLGDKIGFEDSLALDGKTVWIGGSAELILCEADKKVVQSTFLDITQQKRVESDWKRRSETDALTGLLNKGAIEALCRRHMEELDGQRPLALLVFDLDRFKEANDSYGHAYGDEILRRFAAALRRVFVPGALLGRVGGDEFVALVTERAERGELAARAAELCRLARTLTEDTGRGFLSCSIGIAWSDGAAAGYEELFCRADRALYQTKTNGRDGWTFFAAEEKAAVLSGGTAEQ